KGLVGVGAEALRAEWVGGKLAKALNLPIPPFAIAEVDEALVAMSAVEGVHELGRRYAFGSQGIPGAQEITFTQAIAL
ncbi:HipA family kinase, partial [Streptomyces caeruleatus]